MKIIKLNNDARQSLKNGIDKVADIVKTTLGPSGRNVIVGKAYGSHLITNDGVSIAKEIYLKDEIENLGADIIKEVSQKTNDRAGDGTTTATVLAQAIIHEVFNLMADNESLIKDSVNPIDLMKEIDAACASIISELKKDARIISSKEDIQKIAFISVEDETIAELIADIILKLGKDAVITVEESDGVTVTTETVEGMEFAQGFQSPYMATEGDKAVITDPHILVTNIKITSPEQIVPLIKQLEGTRDLVIIGDFDPAIISTFVVNKVKGIFNVLAIKAPGINSSEILKDITALVGGIFIDRDLKMTLETITPEALGHAKKLISTSDKTLIIGGVGDTAHRIEEIKLQIEKTDSSFDKKNLEERIAKLSGGIGVIKVGAVTEAKRGYLKAKIDDAVAASKAALQEGVVAGGGVALKTIAERLPKNILTEAIKAPYNQIQKNAGRVLEIGEDVIDPVKVTRTALENACSVAGILITTEVAIAEKTEEHCCQKHGGEN